MIKTVTETMTICDVDRVCLFKYNQINEDFLTTAHLGIFTNCKGDINLTYLGENITTKDIEDIIYNEFNYRQCAYTTWQEFEQRFCNLWNKNFNILKQNLENVQEFSVIDFERNINENFDSESNIENISTNDNRFSNTPNEFINNIDNYNGLTTITKDNETNNSNSSSTHDRNIKSTSNINPLEKWLYLSSKNRNIIYDFIYKFEGLFLRTIGIN